MELDAGEKSRHPGMKYKGYCIDLIFELQRDLSFNFTLHLVKDGQYGGIDNINNVWNGMVGEIVNGVSKTGCVRIKDAGKGWG